jgi:hypothetical protein
MWDPDLHPHRRTKSNEKWSKKRTVEQEEDSRDLAGELGRGSDGTHLYRSHSRSDSQLEVRKDARIADIFAVLSEGGGRGRV